MKQNNLYNKVIDLSKNQHKKALLFSLLFYV